MVRMAERVGLDGFALTEHFHGRDFWDIYDRMDDMYPSERGTYRAGDMAVIPGGELNIREGAHVIILGEPAELRRLDRAFQSRCPLATSQPSANSSTSATTSTSPASARTCSADEGTGQVRRRGPQAAARIEVNGKDFGTEVMLLTHARALGLPIVAGSDAHHRLQLAVRQSTMHIEEMGVARSSRPSKRA